MSKFSINQQIKQQATFWVGCLNRGLTDEEKPQLIAWINQNPIHHHAIYKSASLFDNINELNELNGIFPIDKHTVSSKVPNIKNILGLMLILPFFIIAIHLSTALLQHNEIKSYNTSYTTKVGEISTFELNDGSKATLNTNSKIVLGFNDKQRTINLLYGEVQFSVAKDIKRPFTVFSGTKSFTALGTVFNVQKHNESDMELVVIEGNVLISEKKTNPTQLTHLISTESSKTNSRLIISGGEKSVVENSFLKPTSKISSEQVNKELAWQNGMLIFNGEPLNKALSEVSRYTNVQFEIINDEVSDIKVAGYFKAGDVHGLLASLSSNFNITYKFNTTNSVQIRRSN